VAPSCCHLGVRPERDGWQGLASVGESCSRHAITCSAATCPSARSQLGRLSNCDLCDVRITLACAEVLRGCLSVLYYAVGAGASEGGLDASNILKPALARGGMLQCIGATTVEEWRQHVGLLHLQPSLSNRGWTCHGLPLHASFVHMSISA